MSEKQTEPEEWTEEPTGDGGSLGTPSLDADERSPSAEVEAHEVVSGGGVVEKEELDPATERHEATQDLD